LQVGVVRRYKKILALPPDLRNQLMSELDKPRSDQVLTVDHAIEAVASASRLVKSGAIEDKDEKPLVKAIVEKFRSKRLHSTVEPRKFVRIARAVERKEVDTSLVRSQIRTFTATPAYTIDDVFKGTVEHTDFAHGTEQLVRRSLARLEEMESRSIPLTQDLRLLLEALVKKARSMMR
jgi:hypothetical protein